MTVRGILRISKELRIAALSQEHTDRLVNMGWRAWSPATYNITWIMHTIGAPGAGSS